ncbi:MAG: twin-arginine translocase TatA/TatE family subunit [Candidatus Omnitrophica bacterium]|nr:twin-arginine translocase TatA/TatE family subunit [Candidatus Omnitrophota bacterium]
MPGPMELLLIFMIVLLFFGARKLPEMAKGLGQAIKEFKKGISGTDKKSGEKEE